MCTATWWRSPSDPGYSVFFNRDELKTRKSASPPAIRTADGVEYLAPADGDFGGTWLLANAFGTTVGLLNHYDASLSGEVSDPLSRGLLVTALAGARDVAAVGTQLEGMELNRYRSFLLFTLDVKGGFEVFVWDTIALERMPDPPDILTTSSFDSARVIAKRTSRFHGFGAAPSPDDHLAFHDFHDTEDGPGSVRMRRDDAQTVSFSRIDVRFVDSTVEFLYRPEPVDALDVLESTSIRITLRQP